MKTIRHKIEEKPVRIGVPSDVGSVADDGNFVAHDIITTTNGQLGYLNC